MEDYRKKIRIAIDQGYEAGYIQCLESIRKVIKASGGSVLFTEDLVDMMIKAIKATKPTSNNN